MGIKRSRQPRSDATVGFILDATDQLLAREGAEAVTTKRVAAAAGVGVGTLYHHFANRTELLRAAERRAWAAEFTQLVAQLPAIGHDTVDAAIPPVVAFTVESVLRRIDSHGVTMDDTTTREAMFEMWNETAELLEVILEPVATRLRRPDVIASLRIATETIALMSWIAALRHRDDVASGEFQRELADLLSRYLLTDR